MSNDLKGFISKNIMRKEITRRKEIAKIVACYKEKDPSCTVSAENVTGVIRYSPSEYIFFPDIDNEYDWEITKKYWNEFPDEKKSERDAIISDIEQEQHIPAARYLDKKSKKSYNCLLGESHYYAVTKNFVGAKKHLEYAKNYIENRKAEISRKKILINTVDYTAITISSILLNVIYPIIDIYLS
jgi:hypothetical protein